MKALIILEDNPSEAIRLSSEIPGYACIVGNKTIFEHQVSVLAGQCVKEFFVITGSSIDALKARFGDGKKSGVSLSYIELDPKLAIGNCFSRLNLGAGNVFVTFGNVKFEMDISRFVSFHEKQKNAWTIVVKQGKNFTDDAKAILDENDEITGIADQQAISDGYFSNTVPVPLYLIDTTKIDDLANITLKELKKINSATIAKTKGISAYKSVEYFRTIDDTAGINLARADYESGKIEHKSLVHKQKAVFLDRDGVINIERSYISNPDEFSLYGYTTRAIKKLNSDSCYLQVIVSNQSAIARDLLTVEGLTEIHRKLETELWKAGAHVSRIYYCPHLPKKEDTGDIFISPYLVECNCRKPKTGMFEQAISDLNIEPRESYMIGDSERDIMAGKKIGCTTIGVMSGHGIRNTKVFPDYLFFNLDQAVNFIIDDPYRKYFKEIKKEFLKSKKSPFIIGIGGNFRSGKSNFSSYLKKQFEAEKIELLICDLDRWAQPLNSKTKKLESNERYNLEIIHAALERFFDGHIIVQPVNSLYSCLSGEEELNIKDKKIVVIEGAVALTKTLLHYYNYKLFIELTPEKYKERIRQFFTWAGMLPNTVVDIQGERSEQMYHEINQQSKVADLVVEPIELGGGDGISGFIL